MYLGNMVSGKRSSNSGSGERSKNIHPYISAKILIFENSGQSITAVYVREAIVGASGPDTQLESKGLDSGRSALDLLRNYEVIIFINEEINLDSGDWFLSFINSDPQLELKGGISNDKEGS